MIKPIQAVKQRRAKPFAILCTLAILTACGTANQGPTVGQVLWGGLKSRFTNPSATPQAQPPITRASLAGLSAPLILVSVPQRGATGTMPLLRTNNGVALHISADGIVLGLRDGVLVNTRGFGDDLISANLGGLPRALATGGGRYTRAVEHLGPEDQLETRTLSCTLVQAGRDPITILGQTQITTRFDETCSGGQTGTETITGTYWHAGGILWQSHQWVSPDMGAILIQKVK